MKKRAILILLSAAFVLAAFGCAPEEQPLKVGLLLTAAGEEDNGINQALISAFEPAVLSLELSNQVETAEGDATADYTAKIDEMYQDGCRLIVLSGEFFEDALADAAVKYPDCNFIAADFQRKDLPQNVAAIVFDEWQAAFLAGFSAAYELQSGRFGALLDSGASSSVDYLSGLKSGIAHANREHGTSVTLDDADVMYMPYTDDYLIAQQQGAQLLDSGVFCVAASSGAIGTGIITEAKARQANGQEVWVIGTDISQYTNGLYDGNNSAVITSALKRFTAVLPDMLKSASEGSFPGAQVLKGDAENGGIAIPSGNVNVSRENEELCAEIVEQMISGEID